MLLSFQFIKSNNGLKKQNAILKLEKEQLSANLITYDNLNSLTLETLENRLAKKDNLLIYISNSKCADCSFFSSTLNKEIKENQYLRNSLYLVDVTKLHDNKKEWLQFKQKYQFDQTPAFLLFKNGKIKSVIQWDENNGLSPSSFHDWLEKNNLNTKEEG